MRVAFTDRFRFSMRALLFALFALTAAQHTAADSPKHPTYPSGWEVRVDPFYGWIPGFEGDVAVFGQPRASVSISPLDILSNLDGFIEVLDGIYIGGGHIRRDRVGLAWDVVHFSVSSIEEIGGNFVSASLDVRYKQTLATLLGSYRVYQSAKDHLDLLSGLRITDVDLAVGLDLGIIGLSGRDGRTWVDPVFGVEWRRHLTANTYFQGQGLIGGFGVSSDLVWDVRGLIAHEVAENFLAYGGFRAAGTDYQSGAFVWDTIFYGPLVGFTLKF